MNESSQTPVEDLIKIALITQARGYARSAGRGLWQAAKDVGGAVKNVFSGKVKMPNNSYVSRGEAKGQMKNLMKRPPRAERAGKSSEEMLGAAKDLRKRMAAARFKQVAAIGATGYLGSKAIGRATGGTNDYMYNQYGVYQ